MVRRRETNAYHPLVSKIIDAIAGTPREDLLYSPFRTGSMSYEDVWMLDPENYADELQGLYERYQRIVTRERNGNIRMQNIGIPPHAQIPLRRETTYDQMARDDRSAGNQRLVRAINKAVREQLETGRE